ncbi:MAG: hypothetical protein ACHQWU_04910 [Gemmatimonadales bacterium]
MAPHATTDQLHGSYTAEHEARQQRRQPVWKWPVTLLAILALAATAADALGYRRTTVNDLDSRVTLVEKRVDSLAHRLELTNYMQCVEMRRNDPSALPSDCAPIFEARSGR